MQTTTNQPTTQATTGLPYPGAHADTPGAYVRYARTLKANGHQVAAYQPAMAKGKAQQAQAAALQAACPGATYVVCNHTSGAYAGFATWAPAYAYSMAQAHTALAPSVVGSLGKQGLAAVPVAGLTQRAPGAPAVAPAVATPATT